MSVDHELFYPDVQTNDTTVNRAYRIALGDLMGNIRLFKDGLLEEPKPVILAGLDYDTPWTRDAAINVWNGVGLLWPSVARNTLLSVLERKDNQLQIGGQYWDAIIWSIGTWSYYLYTGDKEFLQPALNAVRASLQNFEFDEYDESYGLFCGPAVYGDGVAAYPDRYSPGRTSSILDWQRFNQQSKAPRGHGIPMMALSTNCVYYQAYRIADWMAQELNLSPLPGYADRAARLREDILKHFWNSERGTFRYLVDSQGGSDHQEALGHSFALMFDIADSHQSRSVLENQTIEPAGIPCVWPSYERYVQKGGYGRHSGTVWPFISAYWGDAALKYDRPELFFREFNTFSANINRHGQCAEIYHPVTGDVYGGLQEAGHGTDGLEWTSCTRQSWTASAYLRMILFGVAGLHFSSRGIEVKPCLPENIHEMQITSILYRNAILNLTVKGSGTKIRRFTLNDVNTIPFIPTDIHGEQTILIEMD